MGILQNMVNPSLSPTRPDGSELPTFSYGWGGGGVGWWGWVGGGVGGGGGGVGGGGGGGVKVSLVCSNSTVFLRMDIFYQYGEVINSINPRDAYMHY